MKKLKYIFQGWLCLMIGVLSTSCEKTDYPTYDTTFTGIYFQEDSMRYSFGVTPLATTSYTMQLPVRIMGTPVKQKRTFQIEVITDKTTAKVNTHYKMPVACIIEADSINGILPLEVLRENLGESGSYQVTFKLIKTAQFIPVSEAGEQMTAIFNNIVEPPAWKDWQGKPTWPSSQLGPWNPIVWIKFMEYFRMLEETHPTTYKAIVAACGPNLEKVQNGWLWDFNESVKKYILQPLYAFFQEHPEYEVEMPNPNL